MGKARFRLFSSRLLPTEVALGDGRGAQRTPHHVLLPGSSPHGSGTVRHHHYGTRWALIALVYLSPLLSVVGSSVCSRIVAALALPASTSEKTEAR